MDRSECRELIKKAIEAKPSAWADFGSGGGAFTLALAELGGSDCEIYSVEKDAFKLRMQEDAFRRRGDPEPGSMFGPKVHFLRADFTESLNLPPLDGVLMANSLHFIEDKTALLRKIHGYLKPGGKFIVVEYEIDESSVFTPYPVSFLSLTALMEEAGGFKGPLLLNSVPSKYRNKIYSAALFKTE